MYNKLIEFKNEEIESIKSSKLKILIQKDINLDSYCNKISSMKQEFPNSKIDLP